MVSVVHYAKRLELQLLILSATRVAKCTKVRALQHYVHRVIRDSVTVTDGLDLTTTDAYLVRVTATDVCCNLRHRNPASVMQLESFSARRVLFHDDEVHWSRSSFLILTTLQLQKNTEYKA